MRTAELTFALIQTLARGLRAEINSVVSGGWQVGLGRDLRGATLGVIGLGRLGSQVAGFGLAFGMEVVAWSENLTDARADEIGVARVPRERLLETSDFVTIHLRLSDRTRGLIGPSELALMKSDAYLVNTSRGEIVEEAALLRAVDSGSIAGAALDVFSDEPLPADAPLRDHPPDSRHPSCRVRDAGDLRGVLRRRGGGHRGLGPGLTASRPLLTRTPGPTCRCGPRRVTSTGQVEVAQGDRHAGRLPGDEVTSGGCRQVGV